MIYKRKRVGTNGAGRSVPSLKLRGEWLKQLGFSVGKLVRITADPGVIIIELETDLEYKRIHDSRMKGRGRPKDG